MAGFCPFRGVGPSWKSYLVSVVIVIALPLIHLGVGQRFWIPNRFDQAVVNAAACKNFCWDTLFKGSYETYPGGYKHVYFNLTPNSAKIWILVVAYTLGLYESAKYVCTLMQKDHLRWKFGAAAFLSLHSHYYSFWSFVNFYNDGYYNNWYHQLFFTMTEFLAFLPILVTCDDRTPFTRTLLLLLGNIAVLHILSSAADQFFYNIIGGRAAPTRALRDVCFMISDIANLIVATVAINKTTSPSERLWYNLEWVGSLTFVIGGFLVVEWL